MDKVHVIEQEIFQAMKAKMIVAGKDQKQNTEKLVEMSKIKI